MSGRTDVDGRPVDLGCQYFSAPVRNRAKSIWQTRLGSLGGQIQPRGSAGERGKDLEAPMPMHLRYSIPRVVGRWRRRREEGGGLNRN